MNESMNVYECVSICIFVDETHACHR